MKFEYPGFLWAAVLLLIPIIIHLFHFRRYKKVIFPHVRFLQDIQKETQSVKKLRNLLVLLSRLFVLSFLILAFAQPYIPIGKDAPTESTDIVGVYLDNSFSMESEGQDGPIFEEAKQKAREIIGAHENGAQFLIADNAGLGSARLLSKEDAIKKVDETQISHVPQNLSESTKMLRNGLDKQSVSSKNIFLISDFQKEESMVSLDFLDSTYRVTAAIVKANEGRNISIDSAWLDYPQLTLNEAFTLKVKVTNRGYAEVLESTVALDVDGVRKSAAGFDAAPGESKILSMGVTLTKSGWQKGVLSVEDEDLAFDNDYFISFNVKRQIQILAVHGKSANIYLDKLFGKDVYFNLTNSQQGNLDLGTLKKADLLIINELDAIGNGIVSSIVTYVQAGGTVFIVPKTDAGEGYLANLTTALNLPSFGQVQSGPLSVSNLDVHHPLFLKVFEKIPVNPDYPSVTKYYRLANTSGAPVLMKLRNEDIFLCGNSTGNGQSFVMASPLSPDWSNFQQHALFVPVMLKMALSRASDFPLSYTISRNNLFRSVIESGKMQGDIQLKNNDLQWMPVLNQLGLVSYIDAGDDKMSAGNIETFYRDSVVQIASFNFHRRESEMKKFSKADLEQIFSSGKFTFNEGTALQLSRAINTQRLGKRFWKACVILSLIFLAIEILLLRLWPSRPV